MSDNAYTEYDRPTDDLQAIRERLGRLPYSVPTAWIGSGDYGLVATYTEDVATLLAEVDRLRDLASALAFPVEEAP